MFKLQILCAHIVYIENLDWFHSFLLDIFPNDSIFLAFNLNKNYFYANNLSRLLNLIHLVFKSYDF